MKITLIKSPNGADWMEVKRRALITVGLKPKTQPDDEWKHRILEARHSPIRCLWFSFLFEGVPSNTSNHLRTHHIGTNQTDEQFYISSLRNDRQTAIDGDAARRDTPVDMIVDINAEALMIWANKRLCGRAAERTRQVVRKMCDLVIAAEPGIWEGLWFRCVCIAAAFVTKWIAAAGVEKRKHSQIPLRLNSPTIRLYKFE